MTYPSVDPLGGGDRADRWADTGPSETERIHEAGGPLAETFRSLAAQAETEFFRAKHLPPGRTGTTRARAMAIAETKAIAYRKAAELAARQYRKEQAHACACEGTDPVGTYETVTWEGDDEPNVYYVLDGEGNALARTYHKPDAIRIVNALNGRNHVR